MITLLTKPNSVLFATAALLSIASAARISFESAYRGQPVTSGPGFELRVYSASSPTEDVSAVFDTSMPTGGDLDIGSPNQECGGPGLGAGGAPGAMGENCVPLGNVLIAQENSADLSRFRAACARYCNPASPEADLAECDIVCQPDDDREGATFRVRFSQDVEIARVRVLDIDTSEDLLITKNPSRAEVMPRQETFSGLGENSVLTVSMDSFGEFLAGDDLLITCQSSCALIDIEYDLVVDAVISEEPSESMDVFFTDIPEVSEEPSEEPIPSEAPVFTPEATAVPSDDFMFDPSDEPSPGPSDDDMFEPSDEPTPQPSDDDMFEPSDEPSPEPSDDDMFEPSDEPSMDPSDAPMFTEEPSDEPSDETPVPSIAPATPVPTVNPNDMDGDGFTADVDCNDNDPTIFPGAVELPDDGIDQDCDGSDLTLNIGTGAVRVTLSWDSEDDLDLRVTDPTGEVISFIQPTSTTGGMLDRDDNVGCDEKGFGVENIIYDTSAPAGTYQVELFHFTNCEAVMTGTSTAYTIQVFIDDTLIRTVEGTTDIGSNELITSFDFNTNV